MAMDAELENARVSQASPEFFWRVNRHSKTCLFHAAYAEQVQLPPIALW